MNVVFSLFMFILASVVVYLDVTILLAAAEVELREAKVWKKRQSRPDYSRYNV